jgi:hypothetical protein
MLKLIKCKTIYLIYGNLKRLKIIGLCFEYTTDDCCNQNS